MKLKLKKQAKFTLSDLNLYCTKTSYVIRVICYVFYSDCPKSIMKTSTGERHEPPMYLQRPSSGKSQDVRHILASTFRELFTRDAVAPDKVKKLKVSKDGGDVYHERYVAALQKVGYIPLQANMWPHSFGGLSSVWTNMWPHHSIYSKNNYSGSVYLIIPFGVSASISSIELYLTIKLKIN